MATNRQKLVGDVFDGYRVIRRLAQGGMADVYVAEEEALGREVVLKVMLPSLAQDQSFTARFQREAQTTAQLNHPNIVQIYRIGATPGGRPYLAMQYVRGGSLQQKLTALDEERRVLTTTAALALVRQIADALHIAHEAGIVHRDVKPSNILLHENGTPVLTDLGIAAVSTASRLTRTGEVMGTPHYMSPEQAGGKSLDGRSDIYSMGVILYELLAGSVPFQGDSPLAVLHQHVYEPPPFLGDIRPDLSAATLSVVERCLQKDPAERWQDAAAFAAALQNALAAEGGQDAASGVYHIDLRQDTITRGVVVGAPSSAAGPTPPASATPPPAGTETAVSPPTPLQRIPLWGYVGGGLLVALLIGLFAFRPFAQDDPTPQAGAVAPSAAATATGAAPAATPTPFPSLTSLPTLSPDEATATIMATETAVPPSATPRPSATPVPVSAAGRIAFQSNRDGDFEIYIMDDDGGNQQQLTDNTADDQYPVAAADGDRIAFQSERDGNSEIYVMNVDGGGQRRLTNDGANDRLPTWSPDGEQIAFLSDRDGDYDLYIINADGSDLRQVTNSDLRIGHTSWSVDDRLVYNAGTWDGATWELYTLDPSGANERRLTRNGVSDWSPEWSPDGRYILYLSAEDRGDPALYVMNAAGGGNRMLYNSADYEWGADWTADGRIIFTRERGDVSYIYIMDGDGGDVRLLTDRGSYPTWVSGD